MAEYEIEGLNRLVRTLDKASDSMRDLKAANMQAATIVANWAAVRAPRRSGRLAMSVRGSRTARGAQVRSSLVYAGVIHNGWPARHIRPNLFILRASDETAPAWRRAYEAELVRICANVKGV